MQHLVLVPRVVKTRENQVCEPGIQALQMTMVVTKQPQNPFSLRQVRAPASNGSRRGLTVACVAFGLGMVLIAFLSFGEDSLPAEEEKAPRRNSGGLRLRSKLALAFASDSSTNHAAPVEKESAQEWVAAAANDSDNSKEDDTSHVDPEDEMTPNKLIGEAKEKVKQEHAELHASVQDHVFGQKNSGIERTDESTPKVVVTKVVETSVRDPVRVSEARADKLGETDDKQGEQEEVKDEGQGEGDLTELLKKEPILEEAVLSEIAVEK